MAGILKKQTDFSCEFDDMQTLAIGSSKLTYLITPEAKAYLELLTIKQITEGHVCVVRAHFNTKDIILSVNDRNLFDVMYDMK